MLDAEIDANGRDLPILRAAHEVTFFEKAAIFPGVGEIVLGDALTSHRSAGSFGPVKITTTVRNFRLRDVVLDADTLVLLKDSRRIRETSYFVSDDQYEKLHVRDGSLLRLDDNEDVIIGYNRVHGGYHHWLMQCVPAIDWSMRQRTRNARLVLPPLQPWQEDMLVLLGYGTTPRLIPTPGAQYLIPKAEYSQFLNGTTSFGICRSGFATARRILDRVSKVPSPHEIIYVPCVDPYYGSVANEDEVTDFLRRRGVYIADTFNLSTVERVNLFHQAEVVIGPHGAGLTNVLFCKPGALLWELMPRHHQNTIFNRLAQTGGVDYWGDLFETVEHSRDWLMDLDVVAERLRAISRRLATKASRPHVDNASADTTSKVQSRSLKPLDELMLEFESLGDNCEFGLVQRHAGVEPLGLLRFAGIYLPVEVRLGKLVSALEKWFDGLGAPETINVELAGEVGRREFLVKETAYGLMYHTFMLEGQIEADELRLRETTRLSFLRHKLLGDLAMGEKIWIWRSQVTTTEEQVRPLLNVLRQYGPNVLLWVVEADEPASVGTVERIEDDFLKGRVERFAPYENATDIRPFSWFQVCQSAHDLLRGSEEPDRELEEPEQTIAPPVTDMDYLSQRPAPLVAPAQPVSVMARITSWLRRLWRR